MAFFALVGAASLEWGIGVREESGHNPVRRLEEDRWIILEIDRET